MQRILLTNGIVAKQFFEIQKPNGADHANKPETKIAKIHNAYIRTLSVKKLSFVVSRLVLNMRTKK
jgi:hypothetical protein